MKLVLISKAFVDLETDHRSSPYNVKKSCYETYSAFMFKSKISVYLYKSEKKKAK